MTIPQQPNFLPSPIADKGDVRDIPKITPTGTNHLSFASGFPSITSSPLSAGGVPPQREDFNAVFKTLSEHIFFMQSGGFYPWSENLNYLEKNIVLDEEGILFQAIKPSGVDFGDPQPTSNSEYWINYVDKFISGSKSRAGYELGEFYYFRHRKLREGFEPAQGGIIQRANTFYPEAWEYFQTSEGKELCKTEEEWQAMTKATWHTLADETEVGFDGIGGAPFYVQDLESGTLRLPDLRGMYAEAAGFDGFNVGGVHGDMIRNAQGNVTGQGMIHAGYTFACTGLFHPTIYGRVKGAEWWGETTQGLAIDFSRSVPTGNANKPRAWGANACVYLGTPNLNS